MISSGGEGISAPSATRRAMRAERWSPARSQASATNDEPAAIPPAQKYSGISHVHTGGFIIGPCTSGGGSPVRAARLAASTRPSGAGSAGAEAGCRLARRVVGVLAVEERPARVAEVVVVQVDGRALARGLPARGRGGPAER